MTTRCGRRTRMMLGLSLAAATLVGTPGAHAAARPDKPDLTVTHGRLQAAGGFSWVVRGHHRVKLTWRHRTKNAGKAPSKATLTALRLVHGNGSVVGLDKLRVPELEPRKSKEGRGSLSETFDETYDYGTYTPRICANAGRHKIREGHKAPNCLELRPFYVVPLAFTGTVSGTAPLHADLLPGVTLSWEGTVSADLGPGGLLGDDGLFDYTFFEGPVTYTVKGTDAISGCTWSGTGTYQPLDWAAEINVELGEGAHYSAQDSVAPSYHFPVTLTCPNHPGTTEAEVSPYLYGLVRWFDTGPTDRPLLDPGLTSLAGIYNDPRPAGSTTYDWILKPE
jgi:hypothetical protein